MADRLLGTRWQDKPGWLQLLGLCPLLAVTANTTSALTLSIASFSILVTSSVAMSALRKLVPKAARLSASMLIIGLCTSATMLLMRAFDFDLHERTALFVQILVTHCVILARDHQQQPDTIGLALIDSVVAGLSFAVVLLLFGTTREIMANGMALAVLPPGAFLIAGLLVAATNTVATRK